MATKTWYFRVGILDVENLYPGLDYGQGWTVDKKGATYYAHLHCNTVLDNTVWGTSEPPALTGEDWRDTYGGSGYHNNATTTYEAGDWVLAYKVRNNSYYAQKGYLGFKLYKLDSATYSNWTALSGWNYSSLIEFMAANQYKTGTITWNSSSQLTFNYDVGGSNDLLFVDLCWKTSTSGGNNASVVYFCEGEASGETLTSPNMVGAGTWLQKGYWWNPPYQHV